MPYILPIPKTFRPMTGTIINIAEQIDKDGKDEDWVKINDFLGIEFFFPNGRWVEDVVEVYDYLNSIHIDYRGLIEKGLAIEAPEGMY